MYDGVQVTSHECRRHGDKLGLGRERGGATARPVLAGGGGLHSSVATALESLGYPLIGASLEDKEEEWIQKVRLDPCH